MKELIPYEPDDCDNCKHRMRGINPKAVYCGKYGYYITDNKEYGGECGIKKHRGMNSDW